MKKVIRISAMLLFSAALLMTTGCKKDPIVDPDVNVVGTFKQADVVTAVSGMYTKWEDDTTIPESVTVGTTSLTTAQFQYALCKAFTNLVAGKTDDIKVIAVKAASHPERDSYDKETIAISNGAANGTETEDLNNVATRMITRMTEDGQVPNQTLFTRGTENIAFSTNRATVSMARAIAEYKSTGKLPSTVSTEYLSSAATLLGFAKQFVTYLDVWANTTGDVDADGSHCTANKTPWTNVHFIPIPYSGGYQDGTMYSDKYQPYHTITVNNVTYDAAQCWEIALKGILDLVTKEGSSVMQEKRNVLVHTLADGKALNEPIPSVDTWAIWGSYPWYEKADDPCAINFSSANPCTMEFLQNVIPWFLTRASQLTHIGNFQTFNADSPDNSLVFGNYKGNISPMRLFLIAARFYKYLIDNKITSNVYTAMKDVKLDYDLYGIEMPGVTLITDNVAFETAGGSKTAEFTPAEAWTATTSADWLTVTPASGDASVNKITITATANTGAARQDSVVITAGKTKASIIVKQAEKAQVTIAQFAKEYVKILDIWQNTTGTINFLTGEAKGDDATLDVANAHYIPSTTTITVGDKVFTTADMLETAERAYLLLRGYDGTSTTAAKGTFEKTATQTTMSDVAPATHGYIWNTNPFNESGTTSVNNVTTGNGGHLRMGDPVTADGAPCKVKVDILDNFAQRHLNYPITHSSKISNLCGYASAQLAGYYGSFCAQRALITYAFFFKYMLDNNLTDAANISADQIFRSEEFGDESQTTAKNTIEAFAKEYVKILDVWKNTTGTINYLTGEAAGTDSTLDVKNAHYVPSTTTIIVDGKTYTTGDMLEIAERAYLLLRGYDGTSTTAGKGTFEKTTTQATMATTIPETHSYFFGAPSYNESGKTTTGNVVTANGGHLRLGDPKTADGVPCQVKLDILDNFAQRHLNYPISRNGQISNLCGYSGGQLAGYYGAFCAQRALLTYAFFFKYMLDNSLSDATAISADQIFESQEFGDEQQPAVDPGSLMAFAKQVVSYLDVWKNTVDTVDADGSHCTDKGTAWINVHFIPIPTSGGYKDVPMYKSKYQPYHTITVNGTTYDAAQCWEIALKGILDVVTKEGSAVSQVDRNTLVHTLGDGKPMSEAIPTVDSWAKWGTYPWYEKDDAPSVINFSAENPCTLEFMQHVIPWFLTRAAALKHLGNFQTFGTTSDTLIYGNYAGNISAMRMFLISLRFYKYIVDNNITENVYTAMKDVKIDYDLYGTATN